MDWNDTYYQENGYYEDGNLTEYKETSLDFEQFIDVAWFDAGFPFDYESFFEVTLTPLGVCHTFNANGTLWTGFSGSEYNLQMYLDLHTDLYTWSSDTAAGIQVSLFFSSSSLRN